MSYRRIRTLTSNCQSFKEVVSLEGNRQVQQIGESLVIWVKAMRPLEDTEKNGDKSHFQLCPDNHQRRFWRCQVQRADPAFTTARHTSFQSEVMVWGAISFDKRFALSLTPLGVIRGTLTAQRYVDDILRTVLLPFLLQYSGIIFSR
ncbi:transposable element Tc1 transposase [Trichonephila clavipes]|nr:transposable element Tc1 transposase [Trichonephila clavipes]